MTRLKATLTLFAKTKKNRDRQLFTVFLVYNLTILISLRARYERVDGTMSYGQYYNL